ncbi:hypothetical protein IJX73_01735 [bacterium]|nr:hypothetical protein [bacterium]MBQ9149630.1 hypothetical protein [bacterium]
MKLNAINNTNVNRQNKIDNKKNNKAYNNNQNFCGIADSATVFWNFVDAGGRGLQFTVEDMLGTNIPRTYKGAMSGYKYTGKINIPSLLQEAIREFLTGPIMTIAPIAILNAATRMTGKTADTHRANIENLSYLAGQLPKEENTPEVFKEKFIKKSVEDLLEQTISKTPDKASVETLSEGILNYGELASKAKTKPEKKAAKEALAELQTTFESIVKSQKENFNGRDLQKARYSTYNGKNGTTAFSNYVSYITNYANDYIRTNTTKSNTIDLAEKTINAFQTSWLGKRGLVIGSMIGLTGVALSVIPKLYTFASGKDNPTGKEIYAEAERRGGK